MTGKTIRELLAEDFLDPLGFRWTNYGVAPEDVDRVGLNYMTGAPVLPPLSTLLTRALGASPADVVSASNDPRFITATIPAGNVVTTANELSRFFEVMRCGGELDGVRVLEPETIGTALTQQSHLEFDFSLGFPTRFSYGLMLGARVLSLYGRDTQYAFGHLGYINILGWADPERGALSRDRHQRQADRLSRDAELPRPLAADHLRSSKGGLLGAAGVGSARGALQLDRERGRIGQQRGRSGPAVSTGWVPAARTATRSSPAAGLGAGRSSGSRTSGGPAALRGGRRRGPKHLLELLEGLAHVDREALQVRQGVPGAGEAEVQRAGVADAGDVDGVRRGAASESGKMASSLAPLK